MTNPHVKGQTTADTQEKVSYRNAQQSDINGGKHDLTCLLDAAVLRSTNSGCVEIEQVYFHGKHGLSLTRF